jgi:two-component system nitrate/nitrite response regulator NarL
MTAQRLVLADSQLLFVQALAAALEAAGEQVLAVCRTGSELAAALENAEATLCLSDLQLADGSVLGLLAQTAAGGSPCRIVVLTDDARPEVLPAALDSGISGYLQKSRGLDVLLDAIGRVANGEVVVEASFLPTSTARLPDSPRVRAMWDGLTNREMQCLHLMVEGMDTTAMARELHVSQTTVRSHVQAVLQKLGVHSRLEAAALVARHGLASEAAEEPVSPVATRRDRSTSR